MNRDGHSVADAVMSPACEQLSALRDRDAKRGHITAALRGNTRLLGRDRGGGARA